MGAFDPNDTSHLSDPLGPSVGVSASFTDSLNAAWDRQAIVSSAMGMSGDIRDNYVRQLAEASKVLGRETNPWVDPLSAVDAGARHRIGLGIGTGLDEIQNKQYLKQIEEADKAIAEAKLKNPSLMTFDEVYQAQIKKMQETVARSDDVAARGTGILNQIGSFLGGSAASMDLGRNPDFIAPLALGLIAPWRYLALKVLQEAVIGGATIGAHDVLIEGPRNEKLGLPQPNVFEDVLTSALFAGGLRGIGEGIHPLMDVAGEAARNLEARYLPNRAAARVVAEGLDGPPRLSINQFTDDQLREALSLSKTPEAQAALAAMHAEAVTAKLSPLPDTMEGRAETARQINEALQAVDDVRPMNPDSTIFKTGPTYEQMARDAAENGADPALHEQLTTTEAQIADISQRLEIAQKQYETLLSGEPDVNGLTFGSEVDKVKARMDEQMAELEQIRKEARTSSQNRQIVQEEKRIREEARQALTQVSSARFTVAKDLKGQIVKSKRQLNSLQKKVSNLRANALRGQKITYAQEQAITTAPPKSVLAQVEKVGKASEEAIKEQTIQGASDELIAQAKEAEKAKEGRTAKTAMAVEAFRGSKKGEDGFFYTTDEEVAKSYAGPDGQVKSETLLFNDILMTKNWVEAKEFLGLPVSTTMPELIEEAKAQGYDGLSFVTKNGREFVKLYDSKAPPPKIDLGQGRPVPPDLEVAGDGKIRSVDKVIQEMDEEQQMLDAATQCGMPTKGAE